MSKLLNCKKNKNVDSIHIVSPDNAGSIHIVSPDDVSGIHPVSS